MNRIEMGTEINSKLCLYNLFFFLAPPRNFQIGFRMFDFNGDGEVDIDEFRKVRLICCSCA